MKHDGTVLDHRSQARPTSCAGTIAGNRAFLKIWQSFAKINALYDTAKEKYEAYTLEEVVALLQT